ncbi:MAG: ABC transporter ATP-binding protein [Spirochaetes bacterium]|nr:ABC transporter ATP-binding protein [Spirochaetota bacterium]
MEKIILEMRNITKIFPKVVANKNVSIYLREGEVLALLGENGAGKSTLMNILYGLYKPNSGEIIYNGKEVKFHSPKDAIKNGLCMVHQHFMLVDNLTVTENIILGDEPIKGLFIDKKKAKDTVLELSKKYGLEVPPDELIENLPVGIQQRVEILKALYRKAKILILDEPTAVLTPQEVDDLFKVIKRLQESGVSIIIITHKLEEVKNIANRVYVLRRGEVVGEREVEKISKEELARLMVGRDVVLTVERKEKPIEERVVFEVKDLHYRNDRGINILNGINLKIRKGEIVGIAGVDGNGQEELANIVMGLIKPDKGEILFNGENINLLSTKYRIKKGFSYVPADRQKDGLILPMTIGENIIIGRHDEKPFIKNYFIRYNYLYSYSDNIVKNFDIRCPGSRVAVSTLSGGNQQKVILGREFSKDPDFLLVSQPTRGLDVGAIEYIHNQILSLREKNVPILLISLELEEIFALSDRILVIYEGKIVKEFINKNVSEQEVGFYMTGGKKGTMYESEQF